MNIGEVKEKLLELTEMFFAGATVIWTEQVITKPQLPYVTLKCSGIRRTVFPVVDDELNRTYHSSTIWEVNLYTKGRTVSSGSGVVRNYENTATSDLTDFLNFLESDEISDVIAGCGMSISPMFPIRDLTELQNDNRYRYRAMLEFTVSFAQEANGRYGHYGKSVPNHSGGGSKEMAKAESLIFDEVEIKGGNNDEE